MKIILYRKEGDIVKMGRRFFLSVVALGILGAIYAGQVASASDPGLSPRVPTGKMAEAKGLKNMAASDANTLAKAKEIFIGKGACASCHGASGKGDGPAGASFNPKPRNFADAGWQKARTDGEIFWAITNGTDYGMIPFENMLTPEERWMVVNYIRELGKVRVTGN